MVERAREYGVGLWLVINHIDASNVDLPGLVEQIQESFGPECVPLNLPTGAMIILFGTALFFLAILAQKIFKI